MTEGTDINGRKMDYLKMKATGINKCYDCGEIIEVNNYYFRMRKPLQIDVCERCGKKRRMR